MSRAAQRDGILSRVLWYEPTLLREAPEDPFGISAMPKGGCALAREWWDERRNAMGHCKGESRLTEASALSRWSHILA